MVVCDRGNFMRGNFRLKRKLRGSSGSSIGGKNQWSDGAVYVRLN